MDTPTTHQDIRTWLGIESLDGLDTARTATLLAAALAGIGQQRGTIIAVGLAPFVLPNDGAFVLCWIAYHTPTNPAGRPRPRAPPSPR